jgi:hypothetical protein
LNLIAFLAIVKANLPLIRFAGFMAVGLISLVSAVYLPHAEARVMAALVYGAVAATAGKTYLP